MSMQTLVLGGMRSGKSRYAAEYARTQAGPVTLIATGTAQDEEMASRITEHRRNRPSQWSVVEEPAHLAAALKSAAMPAGIIIVDCLTLWLTNLLVGEDPDALRRETASFLETLPELPGRCVLVSNEVGLGVIPANALARRFVDEAGTLHQRLAILCDQVILMVAGLPLTIKGFGPLGSEL